MARTDGVLYLIPGEKYVAEALDSVESLRAYNPELSAAVIAEESDLPEGNQFDTVIDPEYTAGRIEKVFNIHRTPYDRTLYLDSDTHICADITGLFDLLDSFDIAAAHAPIRNANPVVDVPETFPELNGGVFLFGAGSPVDSFLAEWRERYRKRMEGELSTRVKDTDQRRIHDQGSLCEAVYHTDVRLATFPPEYNCRFYYPGYLEGEAKILHGRSPDLPVLANALNSDTSQRVHTNGPNRKLYTAAGTEIDLPPTNWTRLKRSISERGVRGTLSLLAHRLFS